MAASPTHGHNARPSTSSSQQRPALLPAFEPASSPSLPRPLKRKHSSSPSSRAQHYPTPVPTSSTNQLQSSPARPARPGLTRSVSNVSERVPLGDVPSLVLPATGEPVLLGRSSNSAQFQLSANRLISRVHVQALYRSENGGAVVLECLGWNGATVHCRGQAYVLGKGDTFTSDKPSAEIMLDVHDARVLIRWPALKASIDSPMRSRTPPLTSSPPQAHLRSPISPSPHPRPHRTASSTFLGLPPSSPPAIPAVQVYEDKEGDELPHSAEDIDGVDGTNETHGLGVAAHASSSLSPAEDLSDRDEENDPLITSFGPYGANLLPRIAAFSAGSPDQRRRAPLGPCISPSQSQGTATAVTPGQNSSGASVTASGQGQGSASASRSFAAKYPYNLSPVRNHVVNQLAFSRLNALPLSTIMNNLPATLKERLEPKHTAASEPVHELKPAAAHEHKPTTEAASDDVVSLSPHVLKQLLEDTACVGEIAREGKDAAGKTLENEFYYLPELDEDQLRREAVESILGRSGIRSVRKQHKQYYWKRPRH